MSVINQVLRDLDKRQQSAQGARVRSHYQPAGGRPWVWVAALSAAIVVSALVTWWLVAHALTPDARAVANTQADSSYTESAEAPVALIQPVADDQADTINEQPEVAITKPIQIAVADQAAATPPRPSAQAAHSSGQPDQVEPVAAPSNAHTVEVAFSDNTQLQQTGPVQRRETQENRGQMNVQRVERSATELAAQRLDQAVGAMESGEGRKAESLLHEALVLAPQFVDARQQLAAYYYGRGFSSEALRVLREGLAHTPSDVRLLTLSARIYEESGRADEALAMLNRVAAELPQQNDIVVLRAALANELGQHQIAADDYRQLLAVNPNEGIWWLGLAVAEEGLVNYDAARLAYQRAGEDRGLDRASREYARSREEALTPW